MRITPINRNLVSGYRYKANNRHPLYSKLAFGWVFNQATEKVIDIRHNRLLSFVADPIKSNFVTGKHGAVLDLDEDGPLWCLKDSRELDMLRGFTIIVGCQFITFPAAFGCVASFNQYTGAQTYLNIGHDNAGLLKMGSNGASPGTGSALSTGRWYVLAMSLEAGAGTSSFGLGKAYIDGVYDYQTNISVNFINNNLSHISFGNSWNGGASVWSTNVTDAEVSFCYIYKGVLTDAQIAKISRDPDQVIVPEYDYLLMTAAGAPPASGTSFFFKRNPLQGLIQR